MDTDELIVASKAGNVERVKELLSQGVDINCRDSNGNTPLMNLLDNTSDYNLRRYDLLKYCPDLNIKNNDGETLLMIALKNNRRLFCEELLKNGVDETIYNMDNYGNTSLFYLSSLYDNQELTNIFFKLINSKPKIEKLKNNILWDIHYNRLNFNNIIDKYKPILFHFLDGFINPECGYNRQLLFNFMIESNMIKNFLSSEIEIYKKPINILKDNEDGSISISDIVNNKFYNIERNRDLSKFLISDYDSSSKKYIKLRDINDIDYENIFNYSIYITGQNEHQTTIVFFIKDCNFYILSFNSGLGIEKHENDKTSTKKYVPYYGTYIENIDYKNIFPIIKNFISLNSLYKLLSDPIKDITDDRTSTKYYIYDDIKKVLNQIKLNFSEDKLRLVKIKMKYENEYINNLDELDKFIGGDKKPLSYKIDRRSENTIYYKTERIENNDVYFYYMLIDFIGIISKKKINIDNYDRFNIQIDSFKQKDINISDIILNKIILHYNNNQLYIYDQESGSCTWFSIYWSFVYYFILITNNPELYVKFVKYINKIFYLGLNAIFSDDSFKKEYNHDDSKFILMKNVCNKLIDLNILSNTYLLKQRDFIFNNIFKPIHTVNHSEQNKFEIYISTINSFLTDKLNRPDQTEIINNFLNIFNYEGQTLDRSIYGYDTQLYNFKEDKYIDKNNMMILSLIHI